MQEKDRREVLGSLLEQLCSEWNLLVESFCGPGRAAFQASLNATVGLSSDLEQLLYDYERM